jgi:hypothetical protein
MRSQFLRSMLLGAAIGVLAAPVAWAQKPTRDQPASDVSGGTGAERPGAAPMMGPPHAPTAVGQSPSLMTTPDPRDIQQKPKGSENHQPPVLNPPGPPAK